LVFAGRDAGWLDEAKGELRAAKHHAQAVYGKVIGFDIS
jgi:hypothetical protein